MRLTRRASALIGGLLLVGAGPLIPRPPPVAAEPTRPAAGSDFNGDGYSDLAINVHDLNLDDTVIVLYGSAGGLQLHQPQRLEARRLGASMELSGVRPLGRVLTTGNFDGDRYADLVLADGRTSAAASTVRIVYGSASGLDTERVATFENLGIGVATGNFGRGPEDDLAVSDELGTGPQVAVLYGAPAGLSTIGSQTWSNAAAGMPGTPAVDDRFGWALAAGRFSASGYDDLAIGVPFRNLRETEAGAVVVLRGSAQGVTLRGSRQWTQDSAGVVGRSQKRDWFGDRLAVGQLGRGPYEDLVIGATGERIAGHSRAGAVNILYGTADGLAAAGNQMRSQRSPGVRGVPGSDDWFGEALVTGNFGGRAEGVDDLAIGVPEEAIGAALGAGLVHVLTGSEGGLPRSGHRLLTGASPGLAGSAGVGDGFGRALGAGDFDGPQQGRPYDDLVIRTHADSGPIKGGGLFVISGGPEGPRSRAALAITPRSLGLTRGEPLFGAFAAAPRAR